MACIQLQMLYRKVIKGKLLFERKNYNSIVRDLYGRVALKIALAEMYKKVRKFYFIFY